jgi:hypothetical protein
MSKYTIDKMKDTYEQLYRECARDMGIAYPKEPFHMQEEQSKAK